MSETLSSETPGTPTLIPKLETCLICDLVRPELGGKLSILGYYGHCPSVEVVLQYLDRPAVLTFVCVGSRSSGSMKIRFDVVDVTDDRLVASTGDADFNGDGPGTATLLAPTLIAIYGHAGRFQIRCYIDNVLQYSGDFCVQQAPSS